tara:strand:+ start:1320 stop:1835 length:516 start_codon:yes stop_codon:yes gene_type:complete
LSQGIGPTYFFIAGVLVGDIIFALLAMLGLATIAAQYSPLFLSIKFIGGGYLVYLGILNFKNAKHKKIRAEFSEKGWQVFTSGFLLTSSNPKDLLFFIGFLPAFMDLENTSYNDMIIAALIISTTLFFTLSFYAFLADRMRKLFKQESNLTLLNRIAGGLLLLVGLIVIFG